MGQSHRADSLRENRFRSSRKIPDAGHPQDQLADPILEEHAYKISHRRAQISVGSSPTLFPVRLKCSCYGLQTIFCLRYATIMMLSKTFASLAVLSVCTLAVGASPANFARAACEFPS